MKCHSHFDLHSSLQQGRVSSAVTRWLTQRGVNSNRSSTAERWRPSEDGWRPWQHSQRLKFVVKGLRLASSSLTHFLKGNSLHFPLPLYLPAACSHWLLWVLPGIWSLYMQLLPLLSLAGSLWVNDHFSALLFLGGEAKTKKKNPTTHTQQGLRNEAVCNYSHCSNSQTYASKQVRTALTYFFPSHDVTTLWGEW